MPRVFISYVHEPGVSETVLAFSNMLRQHGIDCWIDQYEPAPPMGWQRWCEQQLADADFVLVCCTPEYSQRAESGSGTGGAWEVALIRTYVNTHLLNQTKCIPVVLHEGDIERIPEFLKPYQHFVLSREADVSELYRLLTNQPAAVPVPVGTPLRLPSATPVMSASFAAGAPSPPTSPSQTGWSQPTIDLGGSLPGGLHVVGSMPSFGIETFSISEQGHVVAVSWAPASGRPRWRPGADKAAVHRIALSGSTLAAPLVKEVRTRQGQVLRTVAGGTVQPIFWFNALGSDEAFAVQYDGGRELAVRRFQLPKDQRLLYAAYQAGVPYMLGQSARDGRLRLFAEGAAVLATSGPVTGRVGRGIIIQPGEDGFAAMLAADEQLTVCSLYVVTLASAAFQEIALLPATAVALLDALRADPQGTVVMMSFAAGDSCFVVANHRQDRTLVLPMTNPSLPGYQIPSGRVAVSSHRPMIMCSWRDRLVVIDARDGHPLAANRFSGQVLGLPWTTASGRFTGLPVGDQIGICVLDA